MLLQITCQDCKREYLLVSDDEVAKRVAAGQYVEGEKLRKGRSWQGDNNLDTNDRAIFGICSKCQELARLQADSDSARAAVAQSVRIRDMTALIRVRRPELTLEEAARAAVEFEFLPVHEHDRAFRAYLMGEGMPKDDGIIAKARRLFEAAFGTGSAA